MGPIPVLLVAGVDSADTQVTGLALLADLPGATAVALTREGERLRWCAYDAIGVVGQGLESLTMACRDCDIRNLAMATLIELRRISQGPFVVMLPPGMEALPFAAGITRGEHLDIPVREFLDLRAVIATVSHSDVVDLVFAESCAGYDDEPDDEARLLRGAVLSQIEFADVVALANGPVDAGSTSLLAHLCRPDSLAITDICSLPARVLLERRHDIDAAIEAVDPRSCRPSGAPTRAGITTVDVSSWRPMHPERFLERLDALGVSRARARGSFWLPGRPDTIVVCDAVAGFVSLGSAGTWEHRRRGTRIVVTAREEYADVVAEAFYASLMTDRELARGAEEWIGRPDGFEPWVRATSHHA